MEGGINHPTGDINMNSSDPNTHNDAFPPPPPATEEAKNSASGQEGLMPAAPQHMPGYPHPPGYFPPHGAGYFPPPQLEKLREKEKLDKNNTLYIKNMNTRIKLEVLKQSLQNVFSQYGTLLDIHMKRNFRMRGQAFLVFDSEDAAEKALTSMDGALFYQKPLMINYSRKLSDVIAKKKGTFNAEEVKTKRAEDNSKFQEWVDYIRSLRAQEKLNKLKIEQNELMSQNDRKREFGDAFGEAGGYPGQPMGGEAANMSLLVRNLPTYMNQISLHGIFSHYPGFSELRISPTKESATVVYNSSGEASSALMGKSSPISNII